LIHRNKSLKSSVYSFAPKFRHFQVNLLQHLQNITKLAARRQILRLFWEMCVPSLKKNVQRAKNRLRYCDAAVLRQKNFGVAIAS
jgi:hypothetical protein